MKKLICILLLFACTLLFCYCDTQDKSSNSANSSSSSTSDSSRQSSESDDTSNSKSDEIIDTEPAYSRKRKDVISGIDPIIGWGSKIKITNSFLNPSDSDQLLEQAETMISQYDGSFGEPLCTAHFGVYNLYDEERNKYICYGFEDAKYVVEITHDRAILDDEEISRLLKHVEGDYEATLVGNNTRITFNCFSSFYSIERALLNRLAIMDSVSCAYVGYVSEHQYKVPQDIGGYDFAVYDDISFGIWYLIDSYEHFKLRVSASSHYEELKTSYNEKFFTDNFLLAVGYKSICYEHSHFLDANYLHTPSNYPNLYITWLDENCDCERLSQTALISIPRTELDEAVSASGAIDLQINILNRESNYYEKLQDGQPLDEISAMAQKIKINADNVYLAEDKGIKYIDYGDLSSLYTMKIKFTTPRGSALALEKLKRLGSDFGEHADVLDDMVILYYSGFEDFKSAQKRLFSAFAPCWFVEEIIVDSFDFYDVRSVELFKSKTLRLTSLPNINGAKITSLDEYNKLLSDYSIESLIDSKYMSFTHSDDIVFDDALFEDNFVLAFAREYKGKYQYQRHFYTDFQINHSSIIRDATYEQFITDNEPVSITLEHMYITRIRNSGCSIFGDYNNTEMSYYLDFVVIPKLKLGDLIKDFQFDENYKIDVIDTAKHFE